MSFLTNKPTFVTRTPMNWFDWALMVTIAVSVSAVVYLTVVPQYAVITSPTGETLVVTTEQLDAARALCASLDYTPDSPCAALLAQ